ncbi:MAG: DUF6502 family protein [Steroidobacteraceae bacterium]|nr:DUF6502 family protein [Steroidobacteraceae bacterium]MDW8260408.1 DUF6502 family protein [Gammaproteobacteria bacterium]
MDMQDPIKAHLLSAYRKILRPLVRLLLKAGIRYDEFVELVKGVFVETVMFEGIEGSKNPSRARIAVVTGLSLVEVNRFIDDPSALPKFTRTRARDLVEILRRWHTEPAFSGPYGLPLELPFSSQEGRGFEDLVNLVGSPFPAGALLEDLIASGAVVRTSDDLFRAVSRYYFVREALNPELLENFGNSLTRFANTLQYNSDPKNKTRLLERYVVADKPLTEDVLLAFQKYAREKANDFLVDLDNWLAPYTAVDPPKDNAPRFDTGINVFNFVSPHDPER